MTKSGWTFTNSSKMYYSQTQTHTLSLCLSLTLSLFLFLFMSHTHKHTHTIFHKHTHAHPLSLWQHTRTHTHLQTMSLFLKLKQYTRFSLTTICLSNIPNIAFQTFDCFFIPKYVCLLRKVCEVEFGAIKCFTPK